MDAITMEVTQGSGGYVLEGSSGYVLEDSVGYVLEDSVGYVMEDSGGYGPRAGRESAPACRRLRAAAAAAASWHYCVQSALSSGAVSLERRRDECKYCRDAPPAMT